MSRTATTVRGRGPFMTAAALTLAFSLAACGSGKGSSAKSKRTTTTDYTTTTLPAGPQAGPDDPARAAAKKAAEAILIEGADVPKGWKSTPRGKDLAQMESDKRLQDCIGRPDPNTYVTYSADGPDITDTKSQQIGSASRITDTVDAAKADQAVWQSDKIQTCIKAQITEQLLTTGLFAPSSVDAVPFAPPKHGDAAFGFHITVKAATNKPAVAKTQETAPQGPSVLEFTRVLYVKGRAEAYATLFSQNNPFDATIEQNVLDALGKKIDALPPTGV